MIRGLLRKIHFWEIPGISNVRIQGNQQDLRRQFEALQISEKIGFLDFVCSNSNFSQTKEFLEYLVKNNFIQDFC